MDSREKPAEQSKRSHRHSVIFSDGTEKMLEEIKEILDIDTDTEVLRNAIRVHHYLVMARKEGYMIYRQRAHGDREYLSFDFFAFPL